MAIGILGLVVALIVSVIRGGESAESGVATATRRACTTLIPDYFRARKGKDFDRKRETKDALRYAGAEIDDANDRRHLALAQWIAGETRRYTEEEVERELELLQNPEYAAAANAEYQRLLRRAVRACEDFVPGSEQRLVAARGS
jgi:hypothetical protein